MSKIYNVYKLDENGFWNIVDEISSNTIPKTHSNDTKFILKPVNKINYNKDDFNDALAFPSAYNLSSIDSLFQKY